MSFFQFQNPEFLLLLLLLPPLAWWTGRMGPEAALRFSSTALVRTLSHFRRSRAGRLVFALRLLALVALVIALARPQLGKVTDSVDAEGIDIVVTLDLSGSMRALDLSTRDEVVTRLDAAKKVIREFIDRRPYDRIGIVAFGADAFVVSPLTLNHDWLKRNLDRLELGAIDGSSTAIGTALGASVNRLRQHDAASRIVILLTDGENNAGSLSPLGAAEAAAAYRVKVHTIATGRQGRVPVPQMTRDGRVMRDADGRPLYRGQTSLSRYDETALQEIADKTGGQFYRATESGDLERIYAEIDKLETTVVELRSFASFKELFVWPAALGLALLLLEQVLRQTRYRRIP